MRRFGVFGAAFLAAMVVSQGVSAQSLSGNRGPAETPPSSFTGNQYVDSKGCVFIRAGVSGNVTWVPRVNRDRTLICGARPTGVQRSAPRVAAAPAATAAPAPQTTRTVSRQPAAAPRVVRSQTVVRSAPAPTRQVVSTRQVARSTASTYRPTPGPLLFGGTASRVTTRPAGAQVGGQAYSYVTPPVQVTRQADPFPRNTRQAWAPTPVQRSVQGATSGVVRRQVVVRSQSGGRTAIGQAIPNDQFSSHSPVRPYGLRNAWDDGRLNPNRGVLGQGYVYANPQVQSDNSWYPAAPRVSTRGGQATSVVRSTAPRATVGSGHRYVQVGSFGVASNANRTASRFQGMGLPVRITRSNGLQVVMIGPMNSRSSLQSALGSARRAGFGDAFTRR